MYFLVFPCYLRMFAVTETQSILSIVTGTCTLFLYNSNIVMHQVNIYKMTSTNVYYMYYYYTKALKVVLQHCYLVTLPVWTSTWSYTAGFSTSTTLTTCHRTGWTLSYMKQQCNDIHVVHYTEHH